MIYKLAIFLLVGLVSTTAFSQGEKNLSLQETLKIALERNLDLQLERLNVDSSKIDLGLSFTQYEPTVNASLGTNESTSAVSNTTQGEAGSTFTSTSTNWSATVSKKHWWGFDWSLGSNNFVGDNGDQSSLGETYSTGLSLGANQKLLKGFSFDKEILKYDELVAISGLSISKADLESRIISVLQAAENAYWDLVLAREQLEVNKSSLELAEELLKQNKTKVEVGTLPPIDLINAEAQIANRRREIVSAENNVNAKEDALKKIMNLPVEEWGHKMVPTDIVEIEEIDVDLKKDMDTALAHRLEMRKDNENMRKAMLDVKLRKNDLRPDLTLSTKYSYSGLSAPTNIYQPLINPINGSNMDDDGEDLGFVKVGTEASTYRDALSQLLGREQPQWEASLSLAWNPFNKAGKLNLAKANLALRRQELSQEQTRITIMEDVRNAVRELESNKKAIQASELSVRLSRENLKAEEQKFQNGLVTNYTVSEKQKDLVQEETNLIQAKINYVRAVVTYHAALGKLLEKRQINIQ